MKRMIAVVLFSAFLAGVSTASASDLIYKPINPSFGGDPLNGNWTPPETGSVDSFMIHFLH